MIAVERGESMSKTVAEWATYYQALQKLGLTRTEWEWIVYRYTQSLVKQGEVGSHAERLEKVRCDARPE
jgi:hypothetical protein